MPTHQMEKPVRESERDDRVRNKQTSKQTDSALVEKKAVQRPSGPPFVFQDSLTLHTYTRHQTPEPLPTEPQSPVPQPIQAYSGLLCTPTDEGGQSMTS